MYEDISPHEFLARKTEDDTWRLLDVREPWELATASVPGTVNIPMREIPDRIGELDRSVPIAVLCHSGVRSASVAIFLKGQGFTRVSNIAGGIDAWSTEVDDSIPRY